MVKIIKPLYNMENEAMLVRAEVFHTQLVADLAAFTARFPYINVAWAAAFIASINTANALPLDNQVLSNLKVLTSDVNAQVILGRAALNELDAYAKVTYKKDIKRQRSFGQADWDEAYNDQEKMMNALEAAHLQATTAPYEAELDAKGYTDTEATQLETIATNLRNLNNLQENAKNNRPVTTQDRIVQYNSVWEIMQEINITSKVVFVDNPAKLVSYQLYGATTSGPNTILNVTVNIIDNGEPMVNASVKIVDSELAAQTTDESGQCTLTSVNIAEMISLKITSEGGTETIIADLNVETGTSNDFTVEADA